MQYRTHIDYGYIPGVTPHVVEGDCRNLAQHTPCPAGYNEWHEWARVMSRAHGQVRCPTCGLLAIWLPKAEAKKINAAWRRETRRIAGEWCRTLAHKVGLCDCKSIAKALDEEEKPDAD